MSAEKLNGKAGLSWKTIRDWAVVVLPIVTITVATAGGLYLRVHTLENNMQHHFKAAEKTESGQDVRLESHDARIQRNSERIAKVEP